VARLGKNLCDAMPHNTGADYRNPHEHIVRAILIAWCVLAMFWAAAAAAEYNRSLPRPTEESLAQAAQETVDNMNRKARMGLL